MGSWVKKKKKREREREAVEPFKGWLSILVEVSQLSDAADSAYGRWCILLAGMIFIKYGIELRNDCM
jgi:hypothetical protein